MVSYDDGSLVVAKPINARHVPFKNINNRPNLSTHV